MKSNILSFLVGFIALLFISFLSVADTQFASEPTSIVLVAGGILTVAVVSSIVFGYKKQNAAYASIVTSIFDLAQLQVKDVVFAAIYQHFGWKQRPDGVWEKGKHGREIPQLPEGLKIRRLDLHHIKYLGTERTITFFDAAESGASGFSNFTPQLEGVKMQVIFGIQHEVATGAAATDTLDLLSFGAPAAGDDEFINSSVEWEINKEKELEPQMYRSLFINDDGIKNYLRLPRPIVWEPQNGQVYRQKLSKAYAGVHKFGKVTLVGFEVSK